MCCFLFHRLLCPLLTRHSIEGGFSGGSKFAAISVLNACLPFFCISIMSIMADLGLKVLFSTEEPAAEASASACAAHPAVSFIPPPSLFSLDFLSPEPLAEILTFLSHTDRAELALASRFWYCFERQCPASFLLADVADMEHGPGSGGRRSTVDPPRETKAARRRQLQQSFVLCPPGTVLPMPLLVAGLFNASLAGAVAARYPCTAVLEIDLRNADVGFVRSAVEAFRPHHLVVHWFAERLPLTTVLIAARFFAVWLDYYFGGAVTCQICIAASAQSYSACAAGMELFLLWLQQFTTISHGRRFLASFDVLAHSQEFETTLKTSTWLRKLEDHPTFHAKVPKPLCFGMEEYQARLGKVRQPSAASVQSSAAAATRPPAGSHPGNGGTRPASPGFSVFRLLPMTARLIFLLGILCFAASFGILTAGLNAEWVFLSVRTNSSPAVDAIASLTVLTFYDNYYLLSGMRYAYAGDSFLASAVTSFFSTAVQLLTGTLTVLIAVTVFSVLVFIAASNLHHSAPVLYISSFFLALNLLLFPFVVVESSLFLNRKSLYDNVVCPELAYQWQISCPPYPRLSERASSALVSAESGTQYVVAWHAGNWMLSAGVTVLALSLSVFAASLLLEAMCVLQRCCLHRLQRSSNGAA